MTHELATFVAESPLPEELVNKLMLSGDLSGFTDREKVQYMVAVCGRLGLDPYTKPFEIIHFPRTNKMVMYATKDCTNQLASNHNISLGIVSKGREGAQYVVTARAHKPNGTYAEDIGAVVWPERTDDQANAIMKATTKAKRRATLACVGLGMLTQEEAEDMKITDPDAYTESLPVALVIDNVVQDWIATLESANTVEELNELREKIITIFTKGSPQLDALRPEITKAAERIGAVWSNGEFSEATA